MEIAAPRDSHPPSKLVFHWELVPFLVEMGWDDAAVIGSDVEVLLDEDSSSLQCQQGQVKDLLVIYFSICIVNAFNLAITR